MAVEGHPSFFVPQGKAKSGARKSFCLKIWRETSFIVILQHETLSWDKRYRRKAGDTCCWL